MELATIIATTAGQPNEYAPLFQGGKSKITVNYHVAIVVSNTYTICNTHIDPNF